MRYVPIYGLMESLIRLFRFTRRSISYKIVLYFDFRGNQMLSVHDEDKEKDEKQYGHDEHYNGRLLFMLLVVVIIGLLIKYVN